MDNYFLTINNLSRRCKCKHQEVANDGGGEIHGGGKYINFKHTSSYFLWIFHKILKKRSMGSGNYFGS